VTKSQNRTATNIICRNLPNHPLQFASLEIG
jgi:hypothetical protein